MLSLKEIAVVKLSVEICNAPQLKKEILCAPGSDYDANRSRHQNRCWPLKCQWDELVEEKAGIILENLGVLKRLHEKIIGIVLSVGLRILSWAEYHERALGFSRMYSFNFLNGSFFTTRGIVDRKKAAEELMNDKSLSIQQKYKLALLYCMNNHIPNLYKEMAEKDKDEFYDSENPSRIKQPQFVKFWSYYLKDEVDKLKGDADPNLYMLEMAVKSGNKDVVEYCLEKTNLLRDEALIYAALQAVRNYSTVENDWCIFTDSRVYNDGTDGKSRYRYWSEPWIPSHYYVDILCFLFSKMSQDAQKAFLKKDIEGLEYENNSRNSHTRSRVLEYFLNWPYQDYFMKTVKLMWEFLPEKSFADLIKSFSRKIGTCKGYYNHGEEKCYNYRELLTKFLEEIPEPNNINIIRNSEIVPVHGETELPTAGLMLMPYLFGHKHYTDEDDIIIGLILKNATQEEKERIISSEEGIFMCIQLMKRKSWEFLDKVISICYTSKEEVSKFKRLLSFREEAKYVCIDLITNDEYHAFESFIKWSPLSDVEIHKLKENSIFSEYGRKACLSIISSDKKLAPVDDVIRRCVSSEDRIMGFKKELLSCLKGMQKCVELLAADHVEIANEFIKWGHLSDEEVIQYKKNVANGIGRKVCENWICNDKLFDYELPVFPSHFFFYDHITNNLNSKFSIKGGCRWEKVEKLLTWCFLSENEVNDFKRTLMMKDGTRNPLVHMHFRLVSAKLWKDVETLFAWFDLSAKEIWEVKKETILSRGFMTWSMIDLFNSLISFDGPRRDDMKQFFRWCLADEDDIREFKNKFDEEYGYKRFEELGENISEKVMNKLNEFYLFLEDFANNL